MEDCYNYKQLINYMSFNKKKVGLQTYVKEDMMASTFLIWKKDQNKYKRKKIFSYHKKKCVNYKIRSAD